LGGIRQVFNRFITYRDKKVVGVFVRFRAASSGVFNIVEKMLISLTVPVPLLQ
jgi:hypothetical protein